MYKLFLQTVITSLSLDLCVSAFELYVTGVVTILAGDDIFVLVADPLAVVATELEEICEGPACESLIIDVNDVVLVLFGGLEPNGICKYNVIYYKYHFPPRLYNFTSGSAS